MVPRNVGELESDGALDPPDVGPKEVLGSIKGSNDCTNDGCIDGLAVVSADGCLDGLVDGVVLGTCDMEGDIVPRTVGELDSDGALEPPDVGPEEELGSIEGSEVGANDGCKEGYAKDPREGFIEELDNNSTLGESDVDGLDVSSNVGEYNFEGEFDC